MLLSQSTKELLNVLQPQTIKTDFDKVNYSVCDLIFSSESNTLKITFLKSEKYRTIERYVQRDYVRHPVYSEWKFKNTKVLKTIKITHQTLETLNNSDDFLIYNFRYRILIFFDKESWIPSWAWKDIYNYQEEKEIKPHRDLIKDVYEKYSEIVKKIETDINKNEYNIKLVDKKLIKPYKKRTKLENKLKKSKFNFRIKYLTKKLDKISKKIEVLEKENKIYYDNISLLNQKIKNNNKEQNKELYKIKKTIQNIQNVYNNKRMNIKELNTNIFDELSKTDFIPLSDISYFSQQKITGVYIIRNNENEKYYVGQSKDVLKRLKQHFKGSIPNNIIFAEDYYLSQNKEKLFSVKIIPLKTKDELDNTEKSLIERYDAFNSGYNKTKGND